MNINLCTILLIFRNIISILLVNTLFMRSRAQERSIMWQAAGNKYVVEKIINIRTFYTHVFLVVIMTR